MICTPISTCARTVVCLIGNVQRQMACGASSDVFLRSPCNHLSLKKYRRLHYTASYASESNSSSRINGVHVSRRNSFSSHTDKHFNSCHFLTLNSNGCSRCYRSICNNVSIGFKSMNLKISEPKQFRCNLGAFSWKHSNLTAGFFVGLLVFSSTAEPSYAEAPEGNGKKGFYCNAASADYSRKKKVLSDYSVIGIPGDGRCLFRSLAHGACICSGKPAPNESLQMKLADELRARVAEEFLKRREETEWFIEGDFDTYVSQIRKPHIWGGEPELLMASHVLKMPITVYMYDEDSGGLISIAEYGQEYGKDNPIIVLFHGYGHYDALHIPGKAGTRARL